MKFNLRTFLLQSLASLFIAFAIWLIAKQSNMDTTTVPASLNLQNIPPNIVVEANPREVSLNIQYPREQGNRIVGETFNIEIDAAQLFPEDPRKWPAVTQAKTLDYKLDPSEIGKHLPTETAQVIGVYPPTVLLMGKLRTRLIPIEVRTTGSLASNLFLTGPLKSDPAQLLITGSADDLERTTKALTTPIDLSRITGSMQAFPQIAIPPKVQLLRGEQQPITVDIGISEQAVRKTIPGVPISYLAFSGLTARVKPPTAEVLIEGPASALASIGADDITFIPMVDVPEIPGKPIEVGIEAHLKGTVPAEIAGQLSIRQCRPSQITVEFINESQQNGNGTP